MFAKRCDQVINKINSSLDTGISSTIKIHSYRNGGFFGTSINGGFSLNHIFYRLSNIIYSKFNTFGSKVIESKTRMAPFCSNNFNFS